MDLEIIEAKGIPAMDSGGTSDPYCQFYVDDKLIGKVSIQETQFFFLF